MNVDDMGEVREEEEEEEEERAGVSVDILLLRLFHLTAIIFFLTISIISVLYLMEEKRHNYEVENESTVWYLR